MSEIAIYEPAGAPMPARIGSPGTQDFDSWTAVASEVVKLANVIYDTPFVPDGLKTGPAVAAAILAGRELGLGPMTSLANVHVIHGKPGLSALLMRALIMAQGHGWRDVDVTDTRVVIEGRRKGEAEWTRVTFTADQAKTAKIDLAGYPQDKLYARATTRLARRKFADVIAGMPYSAEDLEDGTPEGAVLAGESYRDELKTAEAAPAPAPRTAQRRQRAEPKPDPTPASAAASAPTSEATTPAAAAQTARPTKTDDGLPPLPGEDEPVDASQPLDEGVHPFDRDKHGTATRGKGGQLTALWTVLNTVYLFTDKDEARKVVEKLISRKLDGGTTGDLSFNEARGVLNSLDLIRVHAEKEKITPREQLIVFLTKIDEAVGGDDA